MEAMNGDSTPDRCEEIAAHRRAVAEQFIPIVDEIRDRLRKPASFDDCCGSEPPTDGKWGDCWCTLPPGHDGEHYCQPCTERHGAPGWGDKPTDVAGPHPEKPMTDVQGRCPACGGSSLFLGEGGHVTCSRLDCPAPGEADDLLHGRDSVYAIGQALGGDRVARLIAYSLAAREHSLADVRRMTDEEFRAIPGIGDESLACIRAAIPAPMPDEQAASIDWQAIVRERERDLKKVDMARYLAEQELARLRAGEEPGWDPATVPTPGQWITRWNAASAEERLEVARQVIEDRARAARCFEMAHEKRIEITDKALVVRRGMVSEAEATIARVRAESARIRAVTPTWGPVADLIDAALDGTAPPTGCPCHNGDELCSGCRRCPNICHGCDGPECQPTIDGKEVRDV